MSSKQLSKNILLAIDVGVKHDKTAMALGVEEAGALSIIDCVVLDKAPFEDQLAVVKAIEAKHHVKAGIIDANGVGFGLAEMVSKQCSRLIKPYTWSS